MSKINGRACVANGRNLYLNSKSLKDGYARNSINTTITVEPFDSTTNMWHIVAAQGTGIMLGIYLLDYAIGKIPDNSDWSYSADVKGTGKIKQLGIENGSMNPIVGTVGAEWSRISQTGHVDNPDHKTIVMYFDTTDSPVDVYIKLPKLELGTTVTPLTPAPVDKVFSDGKQVYGRNLYTDTQNFDNLTSSWFGYGGWTKTTDTYKGLAVVQKNQDWGGVSQYIQVEKGDILTYSVYAKYVSGTGKSNIYWILNNNYEGSYSSATVNQIVISIRITDSWQRISGTAIATSDGYLRPRLERADGSTNTLQISGIKLEKGSVATPWTPAPEDVLK